MDLRSNLLRKLSKIKVLSEQGVDGEQKAAIQLLTKLMKKYGIDENEINTVNDPEFRWFKYKYKDPLSRKLLVQIIYSVLGPGNTYSHEKRPILGCECDEFQAVEIEAKYNFYYAALEKDLELFFSAFVHKNNIFYAADNREIKSDDQLDVEDLLSMMTALNMHEFNKLIP